MFNVQNVPMPVYSRVNIQLDSDTETAFILFGCNLARGRLLAAFRPLISDGSCYMRITVERLHNSPAQVSVKFFALANKKVS